MKTQEKYFNDLKKDTSLVELQNYINNVLEIRGFNNQSIELKLMLLMEVIILNKSSCLMSLSIRFNIYKIRTLFSAKAVALSEFELINSTPYFVLFLALYHILQKK